MFLIIFLLQMKPQWYHTLLIFPFKCVRRRFDRNWVRHQRSRLNETLELIQPHQVFSAILVDHVLVQEICRAWFDSPYFQVLVECLLQTLIQIPVKKQAKPQQTNNALPRTLIEQHINLVNVSPTMQQELQTQTSIVNHR